MRRVEVKAAKVETDAKCMWDSSGLKPPTIKWRAARLTQRVQYGPRGTGREARCGLVKAAQAVGMGAKYALLNTLEMTAARNGAGKEPSIRRNKAPEFRAHLSAP